MRALLLILAVPMFFSVSYVHAEYEETLEDSIMRAEILGENDGKILGKKHPDYKPDKLKEECDAMFYSEWKQHFEEKSFKTSEKVTTTYADWCVKGYNKKSGK